jgi:DNA-binding GntR family transcriptional regulator
MRKSKPLTAKVYDEVYSDIINGNYGAQDIITESALVQRFEVSKSPVREALLQLCNEDVLRVIPRLGSVAGAIVLTVLEAILTTVRIGQAGRYMIHGLVLIALLISYGRQRQLRQ